MKKRSWSTFLLGVTIALLLIGGLVTTGLAHEPEKVLLRDNLGHYTYPITTSVPLAQRYFDQGLILTYGFNHAEAARSFREAARLDPSCAMCFWGEALVLGPNINAPMDPSVVPQAYGAVQKALALTANVTSKEEALINALATRYAKDVEKDRGHLDQAYAEAMRNVFRQYSDDAVVGALLAEALMDLHPWDFWTKEGEPQPWTAEVTSTLETVLTFAPNHPLANHLYIHAVEASPYPEKGLPSAKRLETLVPGSGHLVHMPGHIYIRLGRYRDAALANQRAVKVDQHYLSHSHTESIYTAAYVPHNYHFLWAATAKTGQKAVATQAANDTAATVNPEAMRDPGFAGTLQHFWLMPLYTKALFGQWADVLREPVPPADLLYPAAIRHYARGLAFVRQGSLDQAHQELTELKKIAKDPGMAQLTIFDLNPVSTIVAIAEAILEGELASARGDTRSAVAWLTKAIELEDGLNYTEPKDWYLPPRQVLGAIFMQAGELKEAELVYRKDLEYHPQNGWSLFGLLQSLNGQGKTEDAHAVRQQFDEAWADADVVLTSSRF
jgi:tetratricopeptide (TPR) repeat protein